MQFAFRVLMSQAILRLRRAQRARVRPLRHGRRAHKAVLAPAHLRAAQWRRHRQPADGGLPARRR